ncbi:MAG: metal ABC transporter substrate-binding protein [Thermacetogeniaceae bacterium]|jgi:zinc transport system substrate-binding protein|nr:metal ABC transporter substrate-binding protein [Thermoanaerobacterales bacterium]
MVKWKNSLKICSCLMVFIFVVVLLSGCQQAETTAEDGESKLQVAVTIYPLAEFARGIVGDRAAVTQIIPPGSEPHHWEPAPSDMKTIYETDVFIYHGAGMEIWVEKILPELKGQKVKVIKATEGLPLLSFAEEEQLGVTNFLRANRSEGLQDGEHEGEFDPHVWLDPVLAKDIVSFMAEEIAAVDSENADYYLHNAQLLFDKLDQLDKEYTTAVSQFQNRDIVVSHAAFGYLAYRYGLCQIPVLGITPEQEPDAATLARVIDFSRQQNVKYIFYEATSSPRIAETIAQEIGVETMVLNPIGALTQEDIKNGYDYFDLMHQNLENLKKVLAE